MQSSPLHHEACPAFASVVCEACINTLPHSFVQSIAVTRQLLAGPGLSGGGQLVDTGLWATTSSPRRTSSPDPSLTMTTPWAGTTSGSTGRVEVGGGGIPAARPQEEGCMAVIMRGFGGRRRDDTDLPPGQYRTDDFSLVLRSRRMNCVITAASLSVPSRSTTSTIPQRRYWPTCGPGLMTCWPSRRAGRGRPVRDHDVTSLTADELERTRRDLRASTGRGRHGPAERCSRTCRCPGSWQPPCARVTSPNDK